RRNGIPRQSEDERAAAHAERNGLARLDRYLPEDLFDAELRLDPADEIVRSDRNAARGDEYVCLETARDRVAMRALVVRDGGEALDLCACSGKGTREHECVRLIDLPRLERCPRRDELAPRRKHDDARAARADDFDGTRSG